VKKTISVVDDDDDSYFKPIVIPWLTKKEKAAQPVQPHEEPIAEPQDEGRNLEEENREEEQVREKEQAQEEGVEVVSEEGEEAVLEETEVEEEEEEEEVVEEEEEKEEEEEEEEEDKRGIVSYTQSIHRSKWQLPSKPSIASSKIFFFSLTLSDRIYVFLRFQINWRCY